MSGRFSKSEIDRLGERIRASDRLSVEDLRMLQAWRAQHADALDEVVGILADELGLQPTLRLKTHDALVEKLFRESTRLTQVQDVAGCRIVVDGGLGQQDRIAAQILKRFPGCRLKDRRIEPQHGYRALHVIVPTPRGYVEIQLRTPPQDLWAQNFERLSDMFGKDIKYGGPAQVEWTGHPWSPVRLATPYLRHRADKLIRLFMRQSQEIAALEAEPDQESARRLQDLTAAYAVAVRMFDWMLRRFSA